MLGSHSDYEAPAERMSAQQAQSYGRRMDVFEALYTTRAMRRVKPDPIPLDVQARHPRLPPIRAPSGGNTQNWRFLLVDDPAVKAAIGPIYRECLGGPVDQLLPTEGRARPRRIPRPTRARRSCACGRPPSTSRTTSRSYPLFLFGFAKLDTSGGSIYPSVWSAQLAARALGVGSALTSVAHVPGRGGARHPRGAGRRGLEHGLLRLVRVPDGALGRRPSGCRPTRWRTATGGASPCGFDVPSRSGRADAGSRAVVVAS